MVKTYLKAFNAKKQISFTLTRPSAVLPIVHVDVINPFILCIPPWTMDLGLGICFDDGELSKRIDVSVGVFIIYLCSSRF